MQNIIKYFFLIILSLIAGQTTAQNVNYAVSGNGKYFAYINAIDGSEIKLIKKEFPNGKYFDILFYRIETQQPILRYQFEIENSDKIKELIISTDGRMFAIKTKSEIHIINTKLKKAVLRISSSKFIAFSNYDNFFLVYTSGKRFIAQYSNNGVQLMNYRGAHTKAGYGKIVISNNDRYIIHDNNGKSFNVWKVGKSVRLKSIRALDFKINYHNNNITFVRTLRTLTYSLDNMNLLSRGDLNLQKRQFVRDNKKNDRKIKLEFEKEIVSNTGNYIIIPFSKYETKSLLLYSTQSNDIKEISVDNLPSIESIQWHNDTIIILKHYNNTVSIFNLFSKEIFTISPKNDATNFISGYMNSKRKMLISPNYKNYVLIPKIKLFSKLKFRQIPNENNNADLSGHNFISYVNTGKLAIVKSRSSNRYGVFDINSLFSHNKAQINYFMNIDSFIQPIEAEIIEPDIIVTPANYKQYRINKFRHISAIADSVQFVDLVVKNISFKDSSISINTHIIDADGVYYYGASTKDWKHIWCNLVVKYENEPWKQITDFEVIEHKNKNLLPFATAIVMDHSGSMGENRAKLLQESVGEFLENKAPKDGFVIIKFDDKIGVESKLSINKDQLVQSVEKVGLDNFGGGTAINDAINAAISELNKNDNFTNKSIIVFTDGKENSSIISKTKIVQRAIYNGIKIHLIAYGDEIDEAFLKSLSNPTFGSFYHIYRQNDFNWIFNDITTKTKNYYEIKFKTDAVGKYKLMLKLCPKDTLNDSKLITVDTDFNYRGVSLSGDTIDMVNVYSNEHNDKLMDMFPNIEDFSNVITSENCPTKKPPLYVDDNLQLQIEKAFNEVNLPDVKFMYNSTVIIRETLKGIDEVFDFMMKYPKLHIEISGHTDDDGTPEFNMDLSKRRAEKVKQILVEKGINASQIEIKAYGEMFPLNENSSEANKLKNRRVEFRVLL